MSTKLQSFKEKCQYIYYSEAVIDIEQFVPGLGDCLLCLDGECRVCIYDWCIDGDGPCAGVMAALEWIIMEGLTIPYEVPGVTISEAEMELFLSRYPFEFRR